MLHHRNLGRADLFQIVEFTGPTHDAGWMFPDLPVGAMAAHAAWLAPRYWLPTTDRLIFAMQLFVLKHEDRIIVIDSGVGNGKPRAASSQHMLNTPVIDWLAGIGAPPERVTHVVHTHLHGDHIGWDTVWRDGAWRPLFGNALHCLPRAEYALFHERTAAGDWQPHGPPFADSILPVVAAGLAAFVDPGDLVAGCLEASAAPGHTAGQLVYSLRLGGQHYVFAGDVVHSPIQLARPGVNSRWCELPDAARATRLALLARAADGGATLFPAHASGLQGWRVDRDGEAFRLRA
jgi:glyoxylase-like metal-dependent hydrolase (beta-lactamase superfamily II)